MRRANGLFRADVRRAHVPGSCAHVPCPRPHVSCSRGRMSPPEHVRTALNTQHVDHVRTPHRISFGIQFRPCADSRDDGRQADAQGFLMTLRSVLLLTVFGIVSWSGGVPAAAQDDTPPPGFIPLFNGRNLAGWQGLIELPQRAKVTTEELRKAQLEANERYCGTGRAPMAYCGTTARVRVSRR